MKRLISFAAAAAVLFAAAPKTPSYAAETPAGASCVVYKVEKDHISIDGIGKDFRNGDLVIPEKIDGLPVTCIRENTFFHCEGLKTCVIPDSVEKIGELAFHRCHSLGSVVLPDSVKTLEKGTFLFCDSLKSIQAFGVKKLEMQTFANDTQLTDISLNSEIDCSNFKKDVFTGCM